MDLRRLKPGETVRLANSTPLGSVLTDAKLRRHRQSGGLRIGDGKTIDLIRYAAWLCAERDRATPPAIGSSSDPYERKKIAEAARNRARSAVGKEIGAIPPVADPARRSKALASLAEFKEAYAGHVFTLPPSPDHVEATSRADDIITNGGKAAKCMPRGFGKTSEAQWAVIYAACKGARRFIIYVGATSDEAVDRLEEIKTELETNELLAQDFPEICHPIQSLEGIPQRAKGQTSNGERTHISWGGKRKIVLPTVPGSQASGTILCARGITGAIRGMKHTTADGRVIRPDLAVIDDPQTDASAKNPKQVAKRLRIINGTILQLAGPKTQIAAFMLVTVIERDDLADQVLDRRRNPQWRGQRTAALRKLPTNDKLWNEYSEVWAEGLRKEDGGKAANAFYQKHRDELEAGADVVWPERIKHGDVAALQSLMHVKLGDEATFWAELMGQPLSIEDETDDKIERSELVVRVVAPPRLIVPQHTPRLVSFIDPNSKILMWGVCAFGNGFSGHLVAWGSWPDQKLSYFTMRDVRRSLARAKPKAGRQAQVLYALEVCSEQLLSREWSNEAGEKFKIEKLLVDANWGLITKTVYRFARNSTHTGIITPSHGKYLGPRDRTIEAWPRRDGDRVGFHWRERYATEHAKRFVVFDANRWKSHVADRLKVAVGDPGAFTIYQDRPDAHRMLFDHLMSETPVEKVEKSERLTIWKETPGRDNDLWDVIVGCHVGASMIGVDLAVSAGGAPPKPPRKKWTREELAKIGRLKR